MTSATAITSMGHRQGRRREEPGGVEGADARDLVVEQAREHRREVATQRVTDDAVHWLAVRLEVLIRSVCLLVAFRIPRVPPERDLREIVVPIMGRLGPFHILCP
jgi:hypothetical protein